MARDVSGMSSDAVPESPGIPRSEHLARLYTALAFPNRQPRKNEIAELVLNVRSFVAKTVNNPTVQLSDFPDDLQTLLKTALKAADATLEGSNLADGNSRSDIDQATVSALTVSDKTDLDSVVAGESDVTQTGGISEDSSAFMDSQYALSGKSETIHSAEQSDLSKAPTATPAANLQDRQHQFSQGELERLVVDVVRENKQLNLQDLNPRILDLSKNNQNVLAYIMPDRLPEPPQSRRSLADLYFTVQALPTSKLLPSSQKTLTTDHYKLSLLEGKLAVTYSRIEELKRNEKWSLRQRPKFKPVPRQKIHSDFVIDEMRWMQSNFSEDRKLKIAIAFEVSQAVLEFFESGRQLRVTAVDTASEDGHVEEPGLDHNMLTDESEDAELAAPTANPAQLTLDSTVVMNGESFLPVVSSSTSLFSQLLPMSVDPQTLNSLAKSVYDELIEVPALNQSPYVGDTENSSFTALTKFLVAPDVTRGWRRVVFENPKSLPEGLWAGHSKESSISSIKGRVFHRHHHHDHEVRAPKPPDVRYMSYRAVSIWVPQEDQRLLKLAKDLTYNWDLVSSYMSPVSTGGYTANVERRTAWQCFERWLQLMPSFDVKDLKGRYAEQTRIWLDTSSRAQTATKRRLAPVGVAGDNLQRGHKRLRWSSMLEGIRKAKRKRESQPKGNPMRRQISIESSQSSQSRPIPSAADLSRVKFERDKAVAESYAQQQRAAQAQAAALRMGRIPGTPGSNVAASAPTPLSSVSAAGAGARSSVPLAGSALPGNHTAPLNPQGFSGSIAGLPLPSSVAAAAAAAAAGAGAVGAAGAAGAGATSRMSPEQLQQLLADNRRNAMHHQQQQVQQASGAGQAGSRDHTVSGAFTGGRPGTLPRSAGTAPSAAGRPLSRNASPAGPQAGQLMVSREQVSNLMHQIAQQHPNFTREQVQQMASQQVQRYIQQKRVQAMQAAQANAMKLQQARAQSQSPGTGDQSNTRVREGQGSPRRDES